MLKGLGGLGDMAKMMKAAQEMQGKMAELQEELARTVVIGESGAGLVKARCTANADALDKIVADRDWLSHLAVDKGIRSKSSVCLSVEGADADFIKKMTGLLEKEGAAYDIAGYRDAPAGLRVWCGATVDAADIEDLGPWLDWAYAQTKAAQ